jgi:hypothetical protein
MLPRLSMDQGQCGRLRQALNSFNHLSSPMALWF